MRSVLVIALLAFSTLCLANELLPAGTIQKGSLANQQLIHDALFGVAGKAGSLGCNKIDAVQPYVVAMPEGEPGARGWREQWVVTCSGKHYPVNIRFSEAGMGAANWVIE